MIYLNCWKETPNQDEIGLINEKICKCFHLLALCDCCINRSTVLLQIGLFELLIVQSRWFEFNCCLPVKSRKLKGWPLMSTLFMTSQTWTARHKTAALVTIFKTSKCRLLVKLYPESIEKLLCLFFNPLLLIGPMVRVCLGPP